eukprot:TRINITY_DN15370_c0_g1_i1.p1 TRINITY_DN15370_c0_g1~~TRINITY_DN15370_c0_g1_i1.p1  ORF type:complete len:106 (+),score=16.61 TRINITY_DN15370_c0_g1_i1:124-441(+)
MNFLFHYSDTTVASIQSLSNENADTPPTYCTYTTAHSNASAAVAIIKDSGRTNYGFVLSASSGLQVFEDWPSSTSTTSISGYEDDSGDPWNMVAYFSSNSSDPTV